MYNSKIESTDPFASSENSKPKRAYIIRGPQGYYRLCNDKDEAHATAKSLTEFNKKEYFVEVK